MHKIQSLTVGTSMENEVFSAVALKLRLENGDTVLTRWDRRMAERLIKALGEYMLYLHTKNVGTSSEAVDAVIRQTAPSLSQAEIDGKGATLMVAQIKGRVEPDQSLVLSFHGDQSGNPMEIVITPEYVMPLNDHVGGILDSFGRDGKLIPPSETVH